MKFHAYRLGLQSSAQKDLCSICRERWERCLHIGGKEGQVDLNPMLNYLESFLNYNQIPFWKGPVSATWAELIIGDNMHSAWIWYFVRNFATLGNSLTCEQMEWFNQNNSDTPLLQTLMHISTLLYIPSNLLTSNEMRLKNIFLLDPTTKLLLSWSIDYPSIISNLANIGK